MSLLYAIVGILFCFAFRFDLRFGSAAVLTFIPDMCKVLDVYLIFWRSFDLTSPATAALTGSSRFSGMVVLRPPCQTG